MDRRDGGDPQAPPRPPKLLPRVHRPRAPEPVDMLNETARRRKTSQEQSRNTVTTGSSEPESKFEFHRILQMISRNDNDDDDSSTANSTSSDSPDKSIRPNTHQPLHQHNISSSSAKSKALTSLTHSSSSSSNRQQQHQLQQQLNSIIPSAAATTSSSRPLNKTTSSTTTTIPDIHDEFLVHGNNLSGSSNNRSRNLTNNPNISSQQQQQNGTFIINSSQEDSFLGTHPDYDNYQIHHLTYLPQRPSSLSRNSSHVSTSSSSSITAANSFTRRRLPPTPGASVPLLAITAANSGGSSSSSSFFSHFHNADTAATPVTLAQPRPECQRHSNEYVDTPLRTAHQLQHASRFQHPAGQQDSGPTTTHHVLLLPQRGLRNTQQHQQQQTQHLSAINNNSTTTNHHHSIHSTRAGAGTAGSVMSTGIPATTTRTETAPVGTDRPDGFIHSQPNKSTSSATNLADIKPNATAQQQEHHQHQQPPITKQPVASNCKPGQNELHDIHNGVVQSPHHLADVGANNNSTGIPIVSTGHIAPNSITCPHCGMCRCEQCQTPRLLPERWLCNKTCLCSAETVIDYASCLCCAKAFFYHCARDSDMDYDDGTGTSYLENPCSCGPYKRAQRLGWLGALSLVLPCLWCYWPMRGCAKLGQVCYGYVAGRGCRCTQPGSPVHMLSVMSNSPNSGGTPNNNRANNSPTNGGGDEARNNTTNTKSAENEDVKNHHHYHVHHHHHHHHHEDSKASQMLCEPEKRLLDATHEF